MVVPDTPADDANPEEGEEDSDEEEDEEGMDMDMDDVDMYNDIDSEDDSEEEGLDDEEANAFSFRGAEDLGFDNEDDYEDEVDEDAEGEVIDQESFTTLRPAHGEEEESGVPELDLDRARGGRTFNASKRCGVLFPSPHTFPPSPLTPSHRLTG